jgi:hypothetical protein
MDGFRRYWLQFLAFTPGALCLLIFADLWFVQHDAVRLLRERLDAGPVDVLFLGDSVVAAIGACDVGDRGLDLWLNELTAHSVLSVSEGAFAPAVYRDLLDVVAARKFKPRLLVFPINLRSFSDDWYDEPGYQFELERLRARARFGSFSPGDLVEFFELRYSNSIERRKRGRRLERVIARGRDLGAREDVLERAKIPLEPALECDPALEERYRAELELRFTLNYMGAIGPDHPWFQDLLATVAKARSNGIEVLTYVTPINVEDGTRLVGQALSERVRSNTEVILQVLRDHDIPHLDLSQALARDRFIDRRCACEHVDDDGRRFIASELSRRIDSRLSPAIARHAPRSSEVANRGSGSR